MAPKIPLINTIKTLTPHKATTRTTNNGKIVNNAHHQIHLSLFTFAYLT